ncbi:MAG: barstar family protein [Planctomycetes bacterium]|nr:barstar family protein [Planctomycetota bacterium]
MLRLDETTWECVHFVQALPPEEEAHARRAGLHVATVALAELEAGSAERAALTALAAGLEFPAYFGWNWDAVDDCLQDLAWLGAWEGIVLVVRAAGRLWSASPRAAGRVVEAWLGAAEGWAAEGKPFHLVFVLDGDAP